MVELPGVPASDSHHAEAAPSDAEKGSAPGSGDDVDRLAA